MLKGNREKLKIATNEGLVNTSGKKFIWHLYVVPKEGNVFGFNWPRKILIEVDSKVCAIDYAIRESLELGGKDEALCLDYGMRGCKGYKPPTACSALTAKGIQFRTCACDLEKEGAAKRLDRRIAQKTIDTRAALGAAPAAPCQRFIQGICLLNKKGKKCSSNHNIEGLWDVDANNKPVCVVECALKPHSTIKGLCINSKDCLYKHSKPPKCAPHYSSPTITYHTHARAIVYAEVFDATRGFPGEGPLIVATYNINGTRGSLAAVLAQAKLARIDILLLQELHFYDNGEHLRIGPLADRLGWTLVHAPYQRIFYDLQVPNEQRGHS
jgi:hypothetical protein